MSVEQNKGRGKEKKYKGGWDELLQDMAERKDLSDAERRFL